MPSDDPDEILEDLFDPFDDEPDELDMDALWELDLLSFDDYDYEDVEFHASGASYGKE